MYTIDIVIEFWKGIRDFADRRAKSRYEQVGEFIAHCPNRQRDAYEMKSLRWKWVEKTAHLHCGSCDYVSFWKSDDPLRVGTLVGGCMPAHAVIRFSGQPARSSLKRVS